LRSKIEHQVEVFDDLITRMKFQLHSEDPICLTEHNMTPGQFLTGWILRNYGSLKMSEMAEKLHTSLSTVTGLIDRMVKSKYVERKRVETDRRLVKIHLTKQGKKIIEELQRQKLRHFRVILSALSDRDREIYLRLMRKLVESLDKNDTRI